MLVPERVQVPVPVFWTAIVPMPLLMTPEIVLAPVFVPVSVSVLVELLEELTVIPVPVKVPKLASIEASPERVMPVAGEVGVNVYEPSVVRVEPAPKSRV